MKFYLPIVLAIAVTGCASQPLVDRSSVDLDAPPDEVAQTRAVGATVSWGGRIIEIRTAGDATELEILSYPLTTDGRPDTERASNGRFIAIRNGFVDPLVYDEGRTVTVVGRVEELRDGSIGEQSYRWPVVSVREMAPAPERRRQEVVPFFSIGVGIGL